MRNYEIVSDSSSDLDLKFIKENNINIVPFSVSFDDNTYYRENIDITVDEFYKKLVTTTSVKTSLPSIQAYLDVFTPIVEKGNDVLCICLSSKLSGSYQSAVNAKEILNEEYPDAVINIIDSRSATGGQGHIVKEALWGKVNGLSIEENKIKLVNILKSTKIYFTLDTLEYLSRGGRIGKGAALAGTLLDIKPILSLDEGEIQPVGKIRRRKKAIEQVMLVVTEEVKKLGGNCNIYVCASEFNQEAFNFFEEVKNRFNLEKINMYRVGVTIGVHTGPGVLGIGVSLK
ncbi:MAG: DegV family protein [Lachnospirales bacterium]